MKLKEIREGTWVRRKSWHMQLYITLQQGRLLYYDLPNCRVSNVTNDSSAHDREDFEFCDIGTKQRAIFYTELVKLTKVDRKLELSDECLRKLKEKKMKVLKYEEVDIIVVSNDGCADHGFKTEDEALEYIAERLEASPRTKFKMLKPYQVIEPVKVDLSSMIRKVD